MRVACAALSLLALAFSLAPAAGTAQEGWRWEIAPAEGPSQRLGDQQGPESPAPPSSDLGIRKPPRDSRPGAVFGVAVAAQGGGLMLTLLSMIGTGLSDRAVEIGWGVYLGLAPALGAGLGAAVAKGSTYYDTPTGSMFLGGYLGAALAYLGVALFMEWDDPEVDGEYDGGYFEEQTPGREMLAILTCGLLPLLLPAAGVAIGYAAGRDPKPRREGFVSFALPTPAFFASPGNGRGAPGILLRATF